MKAPRLMPFALLLALTACDEEADPVSLPGETTFALVSANGETLPVLLPPDSQDFTYTVCQMEILAGSVVLGSNSSVRQLVASRSHCTRASDGSLVVADFLNVFDGVYTARGARMYVTGGGFFGGAANTWTRSGDALSVPLPGIRFHPDTVDLRFELD